jgi:nuclear protein localization protein 4 homolog
MEQQRVEDALSALLRLDAPTILPSAQGGEDQTQKRIELAKWLSDWHLLAFLGSTQLVSEVTKDSKLSPSALRLTPTPRTI